MYRDDYDDLEAHDVDRAQAWETWQSRNDFTGLPLPAGRNGIGNVGNPRTPLPQERGLSMNAATKERLDAIETITDPIERAKAICREAKTSYDRALELYERSVQIVLDARNLHDRALEDLAEALEENVIDPEGGE